MLYGREKAWGEPNWQRRLGYWLLGELHIPGRLRSWHIIRALRALGLWDETPRALYDAGGGEGARVDGPSGSAPAPGPGGGNGKDE